MESGFKESGSIRANFTLRKRNNMNRNRTRRGVHAVFSTCLLSLMAFTSQPSLAATYDAVSNFSTTSNPSGSWSYGWKADLGGALTLYSAGGSSIYLGIDSWKGPEGCTNDFSFPLVNFNNTGATLSYASGVVQPANMLNLHPSCTSKFSVVRWVAPTAGLYRVVGLFQGIHGTRPPTFISYKTRQLPC